MHLVNTHALTDLQNYVQCWLDRYATLHLVLYEAPFNLQGPLQCWPDRYAPAGSSDRRGSQEGIGCRTSCSPQKSSRNQVRVYLTCSVLFDGYPTSVISCSCCACRARNPCQSKCTPEMLQYMFRISTYGQDMQRILRLNEVHKIWDPRRGPVHMQGCYA